MTNWRLINLDLEPIKDWEQIDDKVDGLHSWLIEYYKTSRRGERVIGADLKTQLELLIQDMGNPDYRFSLEKAHKRIKFIETQIKHFESPFAGESFILTLEQKAITEAIFGFEYYDPEYQEWLRRFTEVFLLMARKNGKTPYVGALALAEWFCGERGQKVMCASNDYEQAGLVFDCINNFREEAKVLERVTRKNNTGIYFGNRKQRSVIGKFTKQNKGNIKKMSAKQGAKEGRNLKIVIVDEVHEMKDHNTVLPLRSSLTTQKEPLYFEITTEGTVVDGYLDSRLDEARKHLKGEIDPERKRWLVWLYTQDSESEIWADEQNWVKSNPHLGVCKKWSELRELVAKARVSGVERAYTLAKEFNWKHSRPEAWLPDEIIENDLPIFDLEQFRGHYCIAGADLSETNDLSAVTLLFMRKDSPIKYTHTMYFVPEAKAVDITVTQSATNPENRNYLDWQDEGACTIVAGSIIPDDAVARYLTEISVKYGIEPMRVGYDEWHAKEFKRIISEFYGEKRPISITMTPASLDFGTRLLENDLRDKLLNYNQNPICIWNFKNSALRHDSNGRCMPQKLQGDRANKIDGTISKIIAYTAARQVWSTFIDNLK